MFRIIVHRPSYQQIHPLNHAVYLDVNELSKRINNTNHHIITFFLRVKTTNLSSINGSFQNVLYFPVQVDTFHIGNSTMQLRSFWEGYYQEFTFQMSMLKAIRYDIRNTLTNESYVKSFRIKQ